MRRVREFPTAGLRHVVIVNDFAAVTGGSDRVALMEAAELARRGHRVTLIAGHGEPDARAMAAGVSVHTTGQSSTIDDPNQVRAATRGIWNRRAAALVRELTAGADPRETVVHIHGTAKVLSASVCRAVLASGLPAVATLHDYFAACPNGGFFNYRTNEVCRLKPLSARCVTTNCDIRAYSHKLWRVGRTAVQRGPGGMPSGIRHFIAPSRLAGEIIGPFLPPESALHVLPNPIVGERREPVDAGANAPFVFVGRLARDKGPALFARAARQAGVRAIFVGDGPEAAAIRREHPDAALTGWLEPEQVQAIIRRARAIVNASLWYETQGLSALEAAAHGVPAIVSDVTVLREVVGDGETGMWFDGGDVDDLATKLALLESDPELVSRLGRAAYERFWSGDWDLATHLDRLERVYEEALDAR